MSAEALATVQQVRFAADDGTEPALPASLTA
jgi:hypothetical protein